MAGSTYDSSRASGSTGLPGSIQSSPDQLLQLSLELALKSCMAQLRSLRSTAGQLPRPFTGNSRDQLRAIRQLQQYSEEERALKLTLSGIIAQMQARRDAGHLRRTALLMAILPQVLLYLCVADVLRLTAGSRAARTSGRTGGEAGARLVPHLDQAPPTADGARLFLAQVSLGSLRAVRLGPVATGELLKIAREGSSRTGTVESDLSAPLGVFGCLESLELPPGLFELPPGECLPSLSHLHVSGPTVDGDEGGCEEDSAQSLANVLTSLGRPLTTLKLEELEPLIVQRIVEAVLPEKGSLRVRQLVFRRCVLPDRAVALICRALGHIEDPGHPTLQAVHFADCELSELAEQRLLEALETYGDSCAAVVTLDGGTTVPSSPGDEAAWLPLEQEAARSPQAPSLQPADATRCTCGCKSHCQWQTEVARLQNMLALREARVRALEQELEACKEAISATQGQEGTGRGSAEVPEAPQRSRFGFLLLSEDEGEETPIVT